MTIAVSYIAVTGGPLTSDFCSRFVASWLEFPPGYPCDLVVCCNGGPLSSEQVLIFQPLKPIMFPRANDGGWDVTGHQAAAWGPCANYDAMMCCGESVFFHRSGWLKRMVEAWERHGPGMYGPFSSNAVRAHLNTTAFFCGPGHLRRYPVKPKNRADRYQFEHGEKSLWRRLASWGVPVKLVTWDGEWEPKLWRYPKNILWRGDQSNLIFQCNHSEGWANADPLTRHQWSTKADMPYK